MKHWTRRNAENFAYQIITDFLEQCEVCNQDAPDLLSDVETTPIVDLIRYAQSLDMKVALVAYDDGDYDQELGPINSEVFRLCWERAGKPKNFFDLNNKEDRDDNKS